MLMHFECHGTICVGALSFRIGSFLCFLRYRQNYLTDSGRARPASSTSQLSSVSSEVETTSIELEGSYASSVNLDLLARSLVRYRYLQALYPVLLELGIIRVHSYNH